MDKQQTHVEVYCNHEDNSWRQKEIKTLSPKLENKRKGGQSKEKEKGKEYLGIKSKNTMLSTWIASTFKIESCNTQILITTTLKGVKHSMDNNYLEPRSKSFNPYLELEDKKYNRVVLGLWLGKKEKFPNLGPNLVFDLSRILDLILDFG